MIALSWVARASAPPAAEALSPADPPAVAPGDQPAQQGRSLAPLLLQHAPQRRGRPGDTDAAPRPKGMAGPGGLKPGTDAFSQPSMRDYPPNWPDRISTTPSFRLACAPDAAAEPLFHCARPTRPGPATCPAGPSFADAALAADKPRRQAFGSQPQNSRPTVIPITMIGSTLLSRGPTKWPFRSEAWTSEAVAAAANHCDLTDPP